MKKIFVRTQNVKNFIGLVENLQNKPKNIPKMGLVYGEPGLGKSQLQVPFNMFLEPSGQDLKCSQQLQILITKLYSLSFNFSSCSASIILKCPLVVYFLFLNINLTFEIPLSEINSNLQGRSLLPVDTTTSIESLSFSFVTLPFASLAKIPRMGGKFFIMWPIEYIG